MTAYMGSLEIGGHPLISESEGARATITIVAGSGVIVPGTVLGKITASEKHTPSPHAQMAGIEGAERAVAVAIGGCDATSDDQQIEAAIGNSEWNFHRLTFRAGADQWAKRAELAAVGIDAR